MFASTNAKWERREDATSKKHESLLLRMERVHGSEMQGLEKLKRSSAVAYSLETKHGKAVAQGVAACEELAHSEETLAATKSISKKRRLDFHNAKATAEKARGMQKKLKERLSEKMRVLEGQRKNEVYVPEVTTPLSKRRGKAR